MHTVAKAFTWVLNVYNPWKNIYSPQEWLLLTLDFPWFVALFQATQCKPTFGPLCIMMTQSLLVLSHIVVRYTLLAVLVIKVWMCIVKPIQFVA